MAKKTATKKKTAKKTVAMKRKTAPKRKRAAPRTSAAPKKKAAPKRKPAKRAAKPLATPSHLTVERVNVRPAVRVMRVDIRLSAKSPVAPASFRPTPTVGILLPPPDREE